MRRAADFLAANGLLKPLRRIGMKQERRKKDPGAAFLLQAIVSNIWRTGSIYAAQAGPIPKNVLRRFGVRRFPPKSTFYDEVPHIDTEELERFNEALVRKEAEKQERIVVTMDGHGIEVWSRNYAEAAYGATSSDNHIWGYKLFATVVHGVDAVCKHILAPANCSALDFAKWLVLNTLRITGRIDVLLMDREFTAYALWALCIEKGVGFVIPAKCDCSAIKPALRNIASAPFTELDKHACFFERLVYFHALRRNLRVIFVRKFVHGEMHEYELITNLGQEYSSAQVIAFYSKRQGREDVWDRLKNEDGLHKPCKIKDFAGICAFVDLVVTAYNIYTCFSHSALGRYVTVLVMYRQWLFGTLDAAIDERRAGLPIGGAAAAGASTPSHRTISWRGNAAFLLLFAVRSNSKATVLRQLPPKRQLNAELLMRCLA